jgi:CRISPR-associated protein Cas4
MKEMGYEVNRLRFYSMDDNKTYPVKLPEEDLEMKQKFEDTLEQMKRFQIDGFTQNNVEKCKKCIYEPACDRGLL